MSGLSKYQLIFDPADDANSDSVGAYVRAGTDGTLIGATGDALKVDIGSVADLDIRDLTDGSGNSGFDQVRIGDGTDTLAVNADGSINSTVSATDLDIRDLSASQDNVAISDGTDTLAVNADGSINVNATFGGPIKFLNSLAAITDVQEDTAPLPVKLQGTSGDLNITAGDLNVQSDHTGANFDSIRIGDGTELVAISTNNDMQVSDTAQTSIKVTAEPCNDVASQIVATPLTERKEVTFQNTGSKPVYLGPVGVTASTGLCVGRGDSATFKWGANVAIYAICDSGQTSTLRVLEAA